MSESNDGTVYLSASQLAKRWSVSVVTVWRWAQVGRIPQPVKLTPRTTRWRKDEIEACDARRSRD